MDGATAIKHLENAILRLQGVIDLLVLLDGLEDEINGLKNTRHNLLLQLEELESLEG